MELESVVDVSDLVENMQDSFVRWGVLYIFNVMALQYPFLNLPGVRGATQWFVEVLFTHLSKAAIMQAFFVNTAIRKASQAQDYILALAERKQTDPKQEGEYEKAELKELDAFRNFVRVTH